MIVLAEIQNCLNELEFLHQNLKEEYICWASDKLGKGLGSKSNPLTIEFIKKYMRPSLKKEIKKNLNFTLNILKNSDKRATYLLLKEVYYIHPSFHEYWLFSSHYNHIKEVIKGRLGLKSYLTSKAKINSNITIKGVTAFLLKRAILLENLYYSVLEKTLFDFEPPMNIEPDIKFLLECSDIENLKPSQVFEMLPYLFRIVRFLIKNTNYFPIESLLSENGWLLYAPCSINEGPIFYKIADKTRVGIFKECPNYDEDRIKEYLKEYFEIKELYIPK